MFFSFVIVDLFQMLVHVDGAALYAPFSAPGESVDVIVANVFGSISPCCRSCGL